MTTSYDMLVEALRECSHGAHCSCATGKAADAIESLERERDVLLAALQNVVAAARPINSEFPLMSERAVYHPAVETARGLIAALSPQPELET